MMKSILDAMRRFKVLWVALAAIVCVLYGYSWLMTPSTNSNPREKILIRGVFPFDQGLELKFQQGFYTRNPICEYTARAFFFFPQANVSREIGLPLASVNRIADTKYEVEIFRDRLSPGFCDWSPRFVFFRIFSAGQIVQGAALLGFPTVVNSLNFGCFRSKGSPEAREAPLVCLQEGRGTRNPKTNEAEVNFLWKEGAK